MKNHYDVIIVGGGMVGTTFALLLAKQTDLQIALVEAHQTEQLAVDDVPSQRVSAINPSSQQILTEINVWQNLYTSRLGPFEKMQVWETVDSVLHFSAAEIGVDYLGHIVENQLIQHQAIALAANHRQVDLICPEKPQHYQTGQITLENGRVLTADLIAYYASKPGLLAEAGLTSNMVWSRPYALNSPIRKPPGSVFYPVDLSPFYR